MKKINSDNNWKRFTWHCPNCGMDSAGYKNAAGTVKAECKKCHTVMVRKVMGRHHERYDVYLP